MMPKRVQSRATRGAEPVPAPLSADAFETSHLLLELIHVSYATRGTDAAEIVGQGASGPADVHVAGSGPRAPTTHAIRAAIHVYQHGQRSIGELASGLGISYGWASRVVTELEDAGLVARRPDADDRRVVRVSLTPEAIEMVESAYRWRGDAVERALTALDEDGRRAVRTFLRRITEELAAAAQERRPLAG
jgi:DNA-binding MarR family transcriptional regulator